MFEHEWRANAAPYAGRHRKGWRITIGDRRRGYRPRTRVGQEAGAAPATAPDERELQPAGPRDGAQAR